MYFSSFSRRLKRFATVALPLIAAVAIAQAPAAEVCTSIVQAALQAANNACTNTGRNQVCYGNVRGEIVPADGVSDVRFEHVGDIAQVSQIKALRLSPLDEATTEWGVALMQLQANLPDTLPGQNVTFLLFGDVTIEDAVDEQVRIPATTLRATNVRLRPTTNGEVLGALRRGTDVLVTGKYTNSSGEIWLRVKYDEYRTRTGWAYGYLFHVAFDELPDVSPDSLVYNPMQAFYFKTGIGRTSCAEAPTSGVVVQTPEGAGTINFSVNDVNVTLGSTAVISGDERTISVALLEGSGTVETGGVGRRLIPGSESLIERVQGADGGFLPAIPAIPRPISRERFEIVSEVLALVPRYVIIPDPATNDDIKRANPIGNGGIIDIDIQVPGCPPGTPPEQCACNDVDIDGVCDAVPCSETYPTMCIPGCLDDNGDGKCDRQCTDNDIDGRCDEMPPGCLTNLTIECGCPDANGNRICDRDENPVNCLLPGPVICDPGCPNIDADDICDAYDDCIDIDNNGVCDCSAANTGTGGCGDVRTPTPTPSDSPPIIFTSTSNVSPPIILTSTPSPAK